MVAKGNLMSFIKRFFSIFCLAFLSTSIVYADFVLHLKSPLSIEEHQELQQNAKGQITPFYPKPLPGFENIYTYTKGSLKKEELLELEKIQKVEEIFSVEMQSLLPGKAKTLEGRPFSIYQWGLVNQGQTLLRDKDDITSQKIRGVAGMDVDIEDLLPHLSKIGRKEVIVAVIDSGISLEHEDLKGHIYKNAAECEGDLIPYETEQDNDDNGFKGDCKGWDFTGEESNRPYDDLGHGTHVAGIIAAGNDTGKGILGLFPKAKILPLKVIGDKEELRSFSDQVAKAILYAVSMNADIINLSLGWPNVMNTEYIQKAIDLALGQNILIVAAAGNNTSNRPIYPCAYEGVICVGATTINGRRGDFSNYGTHVDFMAPGEDILSSIPVNQTPFFFSHRGYDLKTGTSQAAPFLSSALAMLKSNYPNESNHNLIARLAYSAVERTDNESSLSGLIQIHKAFKAKEPVYLHPHLKGIDTIEVNNDLTFQMNIPFENYGIPLSTIHFSIKGPDDLGLCLSKSDFGPMETNQMITISLKGKVESFNVNSNQKMEILVQTEHGQKKYVHAFNLVVNPLSDRVRTLDFTGEFEKGLGVLKNGMFFSNLNTVADHDPKATSPWFYLLKKVKHEDKQDIQFVLFKEDKDVFRSSATLLSDVKQILSVTRLDLNGDKNNDLLIRAISTKDQKDVISYYYFNSSMRPLFKKYHFTYSPKVAIVDEENKFFFLTRTAQGNMAVPYWTFEGGTPSDQINNDPLAPPLPPKGMHLYTFNVDLGKSEFHARIIDDYKFHEKWSAALDLSFDEHLVLLSVFDKNPKNPSFLFRLSNPANPRIFLMTSVQDNPVVKDYGISPFIREDSSPVNLLLSSGFSQASFVNFQNHVQFNYVYNQSGEWKSYDFKYPYAFDHIVRFLPSFKSGNNLYQYILTKTHVVMGINGIYKDRFPINRVSFLNSDTLNELHFPVAYINKAGAMDLGIYVDAGLINEHRTYFLTHTSKGFLDKLSNALKVPANCKALNPSKWASNKINFTILCKENQNDEQYVLYLRDVAL